MRVFVVWQPMIATDLAPPVTSVLGRISDLRAQQYWDPEHLLAKKLAADARPPQPASDCCERKGILWDLAAVYPSRASWDDRVPAATLFNGPVVEMSEGIEAALAAAKAPPLRSEVGVK